MFIERIRKYYGNQRLSLLLRLLLGSVFLVAGAGKLPHGAEFSAIVAGYGLLPDSLAHIYALLLPWVEIIVGAMLILGILPGLTSLISIAIISSFITANVHILISGTAGMCGCFGEIIPLTHTQSLAANILMLSAAMFLLFRPSFRSAMRSAFRILVKSRAVAVVFLVIIMLTISVPAPALAAKDIRAETSASGETGSNIIAVDSAVTNERTEDTVKPTLLFFYNDECPGCRLQKPVIDALEEEYGDDIIIERVNSNDNMDMLREYDISRVPTMVISGGTDKEKPYEKFTGYTAGEILIESLGAPTAVKAAVSTEDLQNVPPSVYGMSIQPPEGGGYEPPPERIVTPEDVKEAVTNMIAPTGQMLLWAGSNVFGPNAGITIDTGTMLSWAGCGPGGTDDWLYPYTDIYIVPSGSVSIGSTLVDAGGSKNTVWGASGGIFVSATIGYTSPGGNVGPGTYAVVYDECQNGVLDDIDALFDPAFEVVIAANVPPEPASFAAIKQAALQQGDYYQGLVYRAKAIFENLHAAEKIASIPGCIANPAKCLLQIIVNKIKSEVCSALGISWNAETETMTAAANMALYYYDIHADPPDPDYRNLTPLLPVEFVDGQTNDALYLALADFTNSVSVEGALASAFLDSAERYQGADISSDGEWALIHARAMQEYADSLAAQLAMTNGTIATLSAALNADSRLFDETVPVLEDLQDRVIASGFSDNETLALINLGLSGEEIDELAAEVAADNFDGISKAAITDYLADLADANTAAISSLNTFVSDMDGIITTLLADPNVFQMRPQADAGGPYAVDEGTAITLDGTGSNDPDDVITAWEWDLDLDGEFDDASGASPSVSFNHAFNGMIGLMVTDTTSRTGIDYAFITVNNVNSAPSIVAYTPTEAGLELELGDTLNFSVTATDPDGDTVSIQWTINGVPAGTGSSLSYSPTDMSEAGMRIVQVEVSDDNPLGGMVTQIWDISVLAEDTDSDGWRANVDCDDTDPDINPGMTEIIGNGIDDDCDVTTADVPPVADFSYTPPSPMAGDIISFTDESTDDGTVVAWAWDFDDSTTSDVQNPTHSYSNGGAYIVTLTVTDDTGGVESTSQVLTVLSPPAAAFTVGKRMNVASLGDGASIIEYTSVYGSSSSYQPWNAIDGSTSSSWYTAYGQTTDQWLKIALTDASPNIIDSIIIGSSGSSASLQNFEIRISDEGTDDADFTTVLTGVAPQDSGLYEFAIAPVPAKYVQLYVVDNWGHTSYTTVAHLEVITREREGGIVSMLEGLPPSIVDYSSQYSGFSPERLLDDTGSYWASAAGETTNQWIKVELGGGHTYTIERVILKAAYVDYGIRDFEIRVSNTTSDDAAFSTVFTGTAANNTYEQEFAFAPVEARYVELYIINNHGENYIREATFKVLTPDRANVAQLEGVGAFVVAQSSQNSNYSGENAIDFNTYTFWQTARYHVSDQWIKVRLMPGAPYLVDRVKITGPGNTQTPRDFEIRVSNTTIDDASFVTVFSGTLPQDSMPHWAVFPAVEAKYVQLYILNNHGSDYVRTNNFQVYSPELGGAVVPFIDLSNDDSDDIVTWSWDFGDSGVSMEQHPLHIYSSPGTYTVTLTTMDNDGLSDMSSMDYTVLQAPVADFTWSPTVPEEGQNTQFTDLSTDSDGLVLGWLWQFSHTTSQPTSQDAQATFPDNGEWDVTLTVTDNQLLTANVTYTVTTTNVPPTIDAGRDVTAFWGQDWAMTNLPGYSPINSSVGDRGAADRDSLIVDWDFGNGETMQVLNADTATCRVSYSYDNPGVYIATMNATDKDGGMSSDTMTATIVKRGTIQKVYATLTDDESDEIRAVSKLWDLFDIKHVVEGKTVTFSLDGQIETAVTDADGYATVFLNGSLGDTVSVEFTGDDYYTGSSAAGVVGAAPSLPVGDIVFAIDESGSMGPDIEDVKANVANIAAQLDGTIDYQLGLVGFGAATGGHWEVIFPGTPQKLPRGVPHIHSVLSDNISDFDNALYDLVASGDIEAGFSATVLATSSTMGYFRSECPACVILITDEPATRNINEWAPETKADAIAALEARNAVFLGIINPVYSSEDYGPDPGSLADATDGETWDILEFREDPNPVLFAIMDKCVARIIEESSANLSITKIADPEPVIVDDDLTYMIEITNEGPADAIGVIVTDTLSENVTFVSAVSPQGTCTESSGTVECEIDTLDIGAIATVTIIVTPTVEGSVINTVYVDSDRYDPDESNNSAIVVSTVNPPNRPPELDPIGDKEVDEGTLLEFTVTASDPDVDDILEFLASNLPSDADFDVLTQVFSWTPDYEQSGTYEDVYFEVGDGLLFDSENITITVNNVNRIPVASNDDYATDEGVTLVVEAPGILENDNDDDGDLLTAVLEITTANGTLVLNDDGSFTYTPDTDFFGSDNFTYRASDGTDESDIAMVIIDVGPVNDPPVADADGPYTEDEGNEIAFDGTGSYDPDGTIVDYAWDFGDGDTGNGSTPQHTYSDNGTYTITLTVTDDEGAEDTATTTATIDDLAPTAEFTWVPEPQDEGAAIDFTDMSTSSPDIIMSWSWDFAGLATSTDQNPSFTFMDDGIYTITLTVTDEDGSTDSISHDVTVNDLAPTAAFTWAPEPQDEGATIGFTDTSTSSSDTIVSWSWDFAGLGTSTDQNPSFTFMDDGIYTVTLNITDDDGSTDSISHDVTVNDLGPDADLTGDTPLDEGQTGSYDASGSTSSPDTIVIYEWDWEYDGVTFNTSIDTGVIQTHSWSDDGNYTIAVRITDDDGSTDIATLAIVVNDLGPDAALTGDTLLDEGQIGSYDASGSTSSPDAIVLYEWDWDYDGTTFNQSGDTGAQQTHSWSTEGSYTVAVRVTDDDGSTDIAILPVSISHTNNPPVADANGPYSIDIGADLPLDGTGSYDPDAAYSDSIVSYEWDMNDDGSYEYSGATPTVPWADLSGLPQPGVAVPIRLRVTDTFGAINSNATTLTIYDNRPVADFTASPNPAAPTQVITFDGSPSYHTHPGHSIVLYEWDFDTDGTFDASSASPTTTYAYASFGAFTATLRVTDDNTPAKTDSTSLIIQINQGNRPPVADADGPYSIDIGADLPLDGTGSYDPDAAYGDSIVSYEWDMNDDGSYEYSGATPTVPWADLSGLPQPGVAVPIRLRVTDTFGATDSNATTLTIFDNRPVADFIASPNPAAPTQVITFDGSSSYHTHPGHSIILYEWDFDTDGTFDASSASPTTTYAYSSFGAFTAMLRVTDDNTPAKTDSTSLIIQINQGNRPPVADADGPYVLYEGGSITLDGSGSYDPDTAYGDSIVAYEWDLDNDGQYADALGATIMTAFNDDGSYTIGLRVTDSFGASGTDTATVTVEDLAPTAAFTWNPEPQNEGSAIVFTDMSTSSPDNIVSRTWDFAGMGTSPAVNPSFTFMDNGIYTVTLTVTDEDGSTDTISHDVTINDLAPTAAFTWSPEPQNEGSAVTFNDMSTSSPDIIVSRTWDFAGLGTSPAINPSFIFIDNGSYTVTLTVTDEDGSTDTASHDITINDLAPKATLTGDTALDEGQIGNYDASGSTSSPDAIMNYEWDWEYDGTTFNPSGDTGTLQSHSWPAGGIYTVAVRVTDDDGSTGIAALIVTVSRINNPPVANDVPAVTDQDTPVNIMLSAYDPDGDDLSYGIVSPPVNGTLSGTAPDLIYTPNPGYTGPDSFTYMVNDGYLDSNTATVTITVNPVSVEAVLFAVEYAWGAPAPGYKWDPFPLIFIGWTHVRIENRGNTDVYNVTASITGYPTSQTVPDPDVTIGDIAAGASAWSIDTFTTRTDMTITVDPCDGWVWRIEYDDEFGVHHIIENVPEFPPGEGPCG